MRGTAPVCCVCWAAGACGPAWYIACWNHGPGPSRVVRSQGSLPDARGGPVRTSPRPSRARLKASLRCGDRARVAPSGSSVTCGGRQAGDVSVVRVPTPRYVTAPSSPRAPRWTPLLRRFRTPVSMVGSRAPALPTPTGGCGQIPFALSFRRRGWEASHPLPHPARVLRNCLDGGGYNLPNSRPVSPS